MVVRASYRLPACGRATMRRWGRGGIVGKYQAVVTMHRHSRQQIGNRTEQESTRIPRQTLEQLELETYTPARPLPRDSAAVDRVEEPRMRPAS